MMIGGISGNTNTDAGAVGMGNPNMDSYSKSLQKQIADAQKELRELSQNDEMDPDTKMKKRQEIQKKISDLNVQLRQHQMEERRKAQQEKQQAKQQKDQPGKSEDNMQGLSKNSMEAMISADRSLKQAKVQGDTANQMQNGANMKRAEIKLDGGGSKRMSNDNAAISSKWDDVESMEQHARSSAASQISLLAEAQNKLKEANEEGSKNAEGGKNTEGSKNAKTRAEVEKTAGKGAAAPNQSAAIGSNVDVKV